jgi:type IV secretion system protein VirB11
MTLHLVPPDATTHPLAPTANRFPFLDVALRPLKRFLDQPDVTEIAVNRPGVVFIERIGAASMEEVSVPDLTAEAIQHLAERVASATDQAVNAERPLLSAALPSGERFQAVLPPAAPEGGAIAIRRQVVKEMRLADYERGGALELVRIAGQPTLTEDEAALIRLLEQRDVAGFLKAAVRRRVSMVISGGTSTGKTTLLNALLREIPAGERIVTIEDTRELTPANDNAVALLASRNAQGLAQVDARMLLEAALRMRPDRLLLGELRGAEAFSFLRAVNTGHPGSLTTVHADSPRGAYEQLALMVMQAGAGLTKAEILDYLRAVLPVVVQLGRRDGRRVVTDILYARMAEAR